MTLKSWENRFAERIARSYSGLLYGYLKLLEKTVRIDFAVEGGATGEDSPAGDQSGVLFGFWHEDSFFMNLLLPYFQAEDEPVAVVVTADRRGDFIESLISRFQGRAIRASDGFGVRAGLRGLFAEAQRPGGRLAFALDGPLGPRRKAKTLAFHLSRRWGKPLYLVEAEYSRKLSLRWRWDAYVIPMPFTAVTIHIQRQYNKI